jgi:hypothetical protein
VTSESNNKVPITCIKLPILGNNDCRIDPENPDFKGFRGAEKSGPSGSGQQKLPISQP